MRTDRRRRLMVESLESVSLLSALPTGLNPDHVAAMVQRASRTSTAGPLVLNGVARGSYMNVASNSNGLKPGQAGYDFSVPSALHNNRFVAGQIDPIGHARVTGQVSTNLVYPDGTLHPVDGGLVLVTNRGRIDLSVSQLPGTAPDPTSPTLPGTLRFSIGHGTGAYKHVSGSGTIDVLLGPTVSDKFGNRVGLATLTFHGDPAATS